MFYGERNSLLVGNDESDGVLGRQSKRPKSDVSPRSRSSKEKKKRGSWKLQTKNTIISRVIIIKSQLTKIIGLIFINHFS